jgi:hypothetical protein
MTKLIFALFELAVVSAVFFGGLVYGAEPTTPKPLTLGDKIAQGFPNPGEYEVVEVLNGDTLTIRKAAYERLYIVKLAGVSAPKTTTTNPKELVAAAFCRERLLVLQSLPESGKVTLDYGGRQPDLKNDNYPLVHIFVLYEQENKTYWVNRTLIEEGRAKCDSTSLLPELKEKLRAAENYAARNGFGQWEIKPQPQR